MVQVPLNTQAWCAVNWNSFRRTRKEATVRLNKSLHTPCHRALQRDSRGMQPPAQMLLHPVRDGLTLCRTSPLGPEGQGAAASKVICTLP